MNIYLKIVKLKKKIKIEKSKKKYNEIFSNFFFNN